MNTFSKNEYSLDVSLRDLAAPLFRRKRELVITFVVIFLAVIMFGIFRPAPFRSQMSVLVTRERLDPLVTTESTTQVPPNTTGVTLEEINSEMELLQSQDVLRDVVLATGLDKQHHGFSLSDLLHPHQTEESRVARAVKALAKNLKVENKTNSNLIEVSYSSSDPQLSYAVLNALGDFYIRKNAAVHRPQGSFEFFSQETQRYQTALQNSETRLRAFQQAHNVADPDDERSDLASQLAGSIGQLHATEQTIAADQQRIQSDEGQLKVTPQRSATKQDVDSANLLLQNLGTSLLAAETKRTQLLAKYDPSYPLVKEADQEVADAQAAISQAEKNPYTDQETDRDPTYELLREDLAKNQADLAAQKASLTANRRSIDDIQTEMVKLNGESLDQSDLLRDAKANEQNYLLYLSKREQERTSDALDKTHIANVSIAVPPAIPVLPVYSFSMVLFVALGLALVMSVGTVYVLEYFDSSFHTPAQVVDMLGIPVVVAVPRKTA